MTQALAVSLLLITPWLTAQLSAQSSAPAPEGQPAIPTYLTNSRAVVVDVVVTKGQDEPVLALLKQDFTVLEDGKPQPIDFFEEHTAVQSSPDAKLTPMPPNVYTNVPAASLTDSVNVLLLDTLNTPGQDQVYVREQALAFLKTMKPGTRVAIFTLGSQIRIIQGFTSDPAVLQAALNGFSFEFNPVPRESSRNEQASSGGHARSIVAPHDRRTMGILRGEMTLEALRILARYLAAIPGRKNLIWFASTYPAHLFPEKQSDDRFPEMDTTIRETSDLLTVARVAIYPINAQGMMVDHWVDANNGGNTRGAEVGNGAGANELGTGVGRGSSAGPALMGELRGENDRRAHTMSNMEQLAADTGGEATFNTNDLNVAMAGAIDNGAHYYTLVYTPSNKKLDGQFRQIDVKLDPASAGEHRYKLSYRRGYYADDAARQNSNNENSQNENPKKQKSDADADGKLSSLPSASDSDPLTPLLIHGLPSATELIYAVRVLPDATQPAPGAKRAGANDKLTGPTTRYAVDFMIDWKKVELELAPNGNRNGKLQVALLARDGTGKALNWMGGTMVLSLDAATYAEIQKTGIRAHAELDLPRTNVYLATGVYDLAARKAGTLEIPIAPTTPAVASTETFPSSH